MIETKTIKSYQQRYHHEIDHALYEADNLAEAYEVIKNSLDIFIAGNGGSAAIANHAECDFLKAGKMGVRSLVSNPSILTMIANDYGYEEVFSYQLKRQINEKDLVILISSSGNSPNIIKAIDIAKENNTAILGLTGFDGGLLKKRADISIHIPVNNYGIVEDCHQAIMHILAQWYIHDQK